MNKFPFQKELAAVAAALSYLFLPLLPLLSPFSTPFSLFPFSVSGLASEIWMTLVSCTRDTSSYSRRRSNVSQDLINIWKQLCLSFASPPSPFPPSPPLPPLLLIPGLFYSRNLSYYYRTAAAKHFIFPTAAAMGKRRMKSL